MSVNNSFYEIDDTVETFNKQLQKAYIAGLVDSGGNLHGSIVKNDDYSLGYEVIAEIRINRKLPFALADVEEFCQSNNIYCSLKDVDNGFEFRIRRREDCRMFIEEISPFLRDRREEADLFANELIPAIEDGDHLEISSFMDMVTTIEELNELSPRTTSIKYDSEYFQDEFSDVDG